MARKLTKHQQVERAINSLTVWTRICGEDELALRLEESAAQVIDCAHVVPYQLQGFNTALNAQKAARKALVNLGYAA